MEGNGQNDHGSRLNRLEDAYNMMIQDHEGFRLHFKEIQAEFEKIQAEFKKIQRIVRRSERGRAQSRLEYEVDRQIFQRDLKQLLIAQVVMNDQSQKTDLKLREAGEKLDALISWSEQTQRENEQRFRRLEDKQ